MLLAGERASVCLPPVKALAVESRCQQLSNELFINTALLHRTLALNVVHEGGEKSIIFSNQISKLLSPVTRLKIAPVFGNRARQ